MKTPALRKALDLLADRIGDDHEHVNAAEAELLTLKAGEPQRMVAQFHRAMGLPVASAPTVGTPEQRALRVRLMLEEVLEFAKAAGVRVSLRGTQTIIKGTGELEIHSWHPADIVQMTHELADVQYVVSGTAVELGLPLREAVPVIHEANLRKLGPDGKPARDASGKIRKPEGWTPADVSHLLK